MRGIAEGNGDPPGSDLWLTYSGNKEDIWISRIPIPVRYKVESAVQDSFDSLQVNGKIPDWNIYRPRWANVGVAAFPSASNKSLQLEDKDPYDYAKAVRVFAETKSARISFRLYTRPSGTGRLEVEVLDHGGHRPVRVVFGAGGQLLRPRAWHQVDIVVGTASSKYDVSIDGKLVAQQAAFAEPAATVERLSFRTGAFRTTPTRETDRYAGSDLPNPDNPVALSVYNIDDVAVR